MLSQFMFPSSDHFLQYLYLDKFTYNLHYLKTTPEIHQLHAENSKYL